VKRSCITLLILLAVAVGAFSGFFLGKANVAADAAFWSGTAIGTIAPAGTIMQSPAPLIQVSDSSAGASFYNTGAQFDLDAMQPGQQTSLTLYVRNNSKKRVNVYPVINSTPNVEVYNPLGNANLYPGGWAQFVFQVKAVDIGPYTVKIDFLRCE